ncbi:MAG: hypothetical protein H6Q27_729 [Ignavibacteriaceae bacterium]|nr:hypothetical protein [Ignavibacteriaceae bacterium]
MPMVVVSKETNKIALFSQRFFESWCLCGASVFVYKAKSRNKPLRLKDTKFHKEFFIVPQIIRKEPFSLFRKNPLDGYVLHMIIYLLYVLYEIKINFSRPGNICPFFTSLK